MKRSVAALLILGTAGAAGWMLFQHQRSQHAPGPVAKMERPSGLEQRLYALEGSVRSLRRTTQLAQSQVAHSDMSAPKLERPPATNSEVPVENGVPRQLQTPLQVERALHARHLAEPRDHAWSSKVEAEVSALFAGSAFPGTRLLDAQCRSTFCRVVVRSDDEDAAESCKERLAVTEPFATQGMIANLGSTDTPELVIYFSRPGHRLPGPDET